LYITVTEYYLFIIYLFIYCIKNIVDMSGNKQFFKTRAQPPATLP